MTSLQEFWPDRAVLAYLDPVSWLVTVQLIAGGGGWALLRLRRGLRRMGIDRSPQPAADNVQITSIAQALFGLGQPAKQARLVLLLEAPRDWPYLEAVVSRLTQGVDVELWCVAAADAPLDGLRAIGKPVYCVQQAAGIGWQMLLPRINAHLVLTTLTDLGSRQFPKSRRATYAYVFHSPVSTHVAYAAGAFDHYDIVCCPGEVHADEIRRRDKLRGAGPRQIAVSGYPFTDRLFQGVAPCPGLSDASRGRVLLAPSWTNDALYPEVWGYAARLLLSVGWQVVLRPHPETIKRSSKVLEDLRSALVGEAGFEYDDTAARGAPHPCAEVIISDWSGAAIEFALRPHRNVIFVETPRKVRNPDWRQISDTSLEDETRHSIGDVVTPERIADIVLLVGDPAMPALRPAATVDWLANPGTAAEKIAHQLGLALKIGGR